MCHQDQTRAEPNHTHTTRQVGGEERGHKDSSTLSKRKKTGLIWPLDNCALHSKALDSAHTHTQIKLSKKKIKIQININTSKDCNYRQYLIFKSLWKRTTLRKGKPKLKFACTVCDNEKKNNKAVQWQKHSIHLRWWQTNWWKWHKSRLDLAEGFLERGVHV